MITSLDSLTCQGVGACSPYLAQAATRLTGWPSFLFVLLFLVIAGLLVAGALIWKRKKRKQFLVTVVVALFFVWVILTFSGMFD